MMNWSYLAVIPVFGLLVIVHELGHFLAAKWAGIRVEEFGLGFPPNVVSIRKRDNGSWEVMWFGRSREIDTSSTQNPFTGTAGGVTQGKTRGNTIYSLNLLPIGGFVRMPGESGDVTDENGNYDEDSFAAKSAGKRIVVLCAGVVMNMLLAIVLFTIAYSLGEPTRPAIIETVSAGSPAQIAGVRSGDTILKVNGKPVSMFDDMRAIVTKAISDDKGKSASVPVTLDVRHRDGTTQTLLVNARTHATAQQGAMGVSGAIVMVKAPLWQAPLKGLSYTYETTRLILSALGQMITRTIPVQLSGPVGIAQVTGSVAEAVPNYGWFPILSLTGLLSVNLAIFNILPFPALDGGRVVLVLVELLRGGKRLKPEREGLINFIGFAVLLLLLVVVTISDVAHWGS
ncbi:M50 family metallopeptidase [Tengunoibacter tsumagoiensis]|uniref:RIP metalloprotease RseP n=1 Tax=Tengunoibacter tsumagoiensis TaxID=2014871 RepID=A0A401ZXY3_9CHLR|nr:M50 family metallopeptidase [Tengunoibacter tsumagoiensis]GCE11716.1 RIP metalloprotease RseP [Tengunoibacter tsumagoiensis]